MGGVISQKRQRAAFPASFNALNEEERSYTALFPYNKPDFLRRIFIPGVFAAFLAAPEWQVQHLWVHNDWALPLGPVLELEETEDGLLFKAQFSDTVLGRDAWQLVRDGAINAVSIAWAPIQVERQERNGVTFLLQQRAKLYDVSPVNFGGMPGAKILRDRMALHFTEPGHAHPSDYVDGMPRNPEKCCSGDRCHHATPLPYQPTDISQRPLEGADAQERARQQLRLLGLHIREVGKDS